MSVSDLIPKQMSDVHKRGAFRLLNDGPENKEGLLNCLRDSLSRREPLRDGRGRQRERRYQGVNIKFRLDMSGFDDRRGLFCWMPSTSEWLLSCSFDSSMQAVLTAGASGQ